MFGNTSKNYRNFNELMSNCCQIYWLEFSIFWPFMRIGLKPGLGMGKSIFKGRWGGGIQGGTLSKYPQKSVTWGTLTELKCCSRKYRKN